MAWATLPEARAHWDDAAGIADDTLTALLDAAFEECAEYAPSIAARTVYDAVTTSGSVEVTSTTAFFGPSDVGRGVTGTGVPVATTITRVVDSSTVKLSAAATASGSDVELTVAAGEVPTRYMLANVYQAREIFTAQKRGDASADVIGFGDFAIRARPLSAVVRQLLRPQGHSKLGFA